MAWLEHGMARVYYEDAGSGEPVLLLPGFGGSIEELSALREALLSAGYRVVAADLPGSGRSEPQPREYTTTYYEDDARSFAALLQHLQVAAAHLVGFSDGGEVALLMAALFPQVARSIVTWGSAGQLRDPGGHLGAAMHNMIDNPIPPMRPFREHLIATYGEINARAMTQSFAAAIGQIIEGGGSISLAKAGNITGPVLLITGEHDFMASPQLLDELATHIRTVEVLKVEGAGHDVHHSHAEWLAQAVLDWLRRH
jgi:pimeloyl-ACP methyl ester carboxylesterase